jgi:hypothetical protein
MQNAERRMNRKQARLRSPRRSAFCVRRRDSATALIETAIVLPLYMILLYGLIYFGSATLARQRQDKATAYAAWQSAPPLVTDLLTAFWGSAQPADTTFSVNGGSENGQLIRQGDEYYGMQRNLAAQGVQWAWPGQPNYNVQYNYSDDITGTVTTFVPYQLGFFHQISGGGSGLFDAERVSVDLWNFALGATWQSFNWVPGQGIQQQFNTSYTDFSNYLNKASPANQQTNGGLLFADNADPPTLELASTNGTWPADCGGILAAALNGPPGGGQWLQRCAAESTVMYTPLFLGQVYADQGDQTTTFNQYVSYNYNGPTDLQELATSTMDCDVTIRTSVVRQGAEEPPQTATALLDQATGLLGASQVSPDLMSEQLPAMDQQLLALPTVKGSWNPN